MKLPDDVWQVVKDYLRTHKSYDVSDEFKPLLEQATQIELFDGGAFVAVGNEFDLFVVPERRGRWRIRSVVGDYLRRMARQHGTVAVRINERNAASLRLAKHFGFLEVARDNGVIRLEKKHGRDS